MRPICLLLCLAFVCSFAVLSPPGDCHAQQVLELPQDGHTAYVTLCGKPGEKRFERLRSWFHFVPVLKAIARATHFHAIDTRHRWYGGRYVKLAKCLPCVIVQTADGEKLLEVTDVSTPVNLANEINGCIRNRRERNQQEQNVNPVPSADSDTPPAVDPAPAKQTAVEVKDGWNPVAVICFAIAAVVVGGAIGIGINWAANG